MSGILYKSSSGVQKRGSYCFSSVCLGRLAVYGIGCTHIILRDMILTPDTKVYFYFSGGRY
ncbi:hypothetical protein BCR42DRAFT_403721 [Absidia repens]|uniref:Uncharacterized protein n=1 Tax=Absidia repens TaxID=90262 RepID=A0A1X2IVA4_9FUNG|nr:hypothetical protein BCR42DRAFT_403721 [Absidia repens]